MFSLSRATLVQVGAGTSGEAARQQAHSWAKCQKTAKNYKRYELRSYLISDQPKQFWTEQNKSIKGTYIDDVWCF